MKRCPECDFIYEDEQCQCDMDGTALLTDCHILPEAPTVSSPPARPVWLRLTVAVSLSVLSGLGYYALSNQMGPQESRPVLLTVANAKDSTSSTSAPKTPGSESADAGTMKSLDETASVKSAVNKDLPSTDSVGSPRSARRQVAGRGSGQGKDYSGIGTFLKKTGRLLKKPFEN
jgi:hypothetical protein